MVKSSKSIDLRTLCRGIDLDIKRPVLIMSSPQIDAISATGLLCRVIYKNQGIFHVTFFDVIYNSEQLNSTIEKYPDYQPITVGLELDSSIQNISSQDRVIFIGKSNVEHKNVQHIDSGVCVPAAVYVFAREKFGVGKDELKIALMGILSSTQTNEDNLIHELVAEGTQKGLIRETRGLRLFGSNFLPLVDVFQYSFRPFMRGLSGNRSGVEKLIEMAEIPFSMRESTISVLNTEQKQHLTANLIPQLDPWSLKQVLGQDFEFLSEGEKSPLRYMSNIRSLLETLWMRQEMGIALGIIIGDKAQLLRKSVDTYLLHAKEVIYGVQRVLESGFTEHRGEDSPISMVSLSIQNKEVLPDIARILIENGIAERQYVMLISGNSVAISWKQGVGSISEALKHFRNVGLTPVATSSTSIRFDNVNAEMVATIRERTAEYAKCIQSSV